MNLNQLLKEATHSDIITYRVYDNDNFVSWAIGYFKNETLLFAEPFSLYGNDDPYDVKFYRRVSQKEISDYYIDTITSLKDDEGFVIHDSIGKIITSNTYFIKFYDFKNSLNIE